MPLVGRDWFFASLTRIFFCPARVGTGLQYEPAGRVFARIDFSGFLRGVDKFAMGRVFQDFCWAGTGSRWPAPPSFPPLLYQQFFLQSNGFACSSYFAVSAMGSLTARVARLLRVSPARTNSSLGLQKGSQLWYSTISFADEDDNQEIDNECFVENKRGLEPQGVDPKKGWGFRGVHKAIICGKIGQAPVQKILRNGKTVTIFTVGTGGMFDQRIQGASNLPKPAQWHRIAVHNEHLGAYAVQQLVKNSSVFVEGDIETRTYNDSISGQIKNIPEICVRRDGKIRLVKTGEGVGNVSLDDLRDGLL
ncbi:hypothetical protein H6P81_012582 [Aristolochia fimbriata]|uniref:Single-stranded DNA-binding protein, mitochondrial n=1 Tax=Aristolochia fimbriata TaxID=158543 RepID=A0AAV7EDT1_ARIFI|nr:hypothetical protein H6P81_012582 [Aristolochia fimbriata]